MNQTPERISETPKHNWVTMKEKTNSLAPLQIYDQLIWNPNFIPLGEQLEIDTVATNKLLQMMNFRSLFEIKNYSPKKQGQDFQVQGHISQMGELAATGISLYQKKKSKEQLDLLYYPASNKLVAKINFSDNLRQAQDKSKDNIDPKAFTQQYARLINNDLRSIIHELPLEIHKNYFGPEMLIEQANLMGTLFATGLVFSVSRNPGFSTVFFSICYIFTKEFGAKKLFRSGALAPFYQQYDSRRRDRMHLDQLYPEKAKLDKLSRLGPSYNIYIRLLPALRFYLNHHELIRARK